MIFSAEVSVSAYFSYSFAVAIMSASINRGHAMSNTERRTLKMHPRMLWDIIHRQAGTISKAILEGVMNVVDAGGTKCEIKIDRKSFSIIDDGKGFKNMTEIENFFETFGHPHEEGDAKYGRFRMGRGQIMAFGISRWSSTTFRMHVDLKPMKDEKGKDFALGYELSDGNESFNGCKIEVDLYEHLAPSLLDATIREVQDYVKFVNIPVILNGKVISKDPAKEEWDVETDEFYVKKRASGSLDVYNQGVLVSKYNSYRFGCSGLVVSKVPLDVNFARNDVVSSCKVFKKVTKHLNDEAIKQARKAPLTDSQRDNFIRRLVTGEISLRDVGTTRVITDVTGSHHKFEIFKELVKFSNKISIAPRGDRVGEVAHNRKLAFFVTPETADRFGADTPKQLLKVLKEVLTANGDSHALRSVSAVTRDTFLEEISSHHEAVKDSELNKAERIALKAIRAGYKVLCYEGYWHDRRHVTNEFNFSDRPYEHVARKIDVGMSVTAQAWTNGTTHTWINRDKLKLVRQGIDGMMRLAALMLHEQLHDEPSTGTHEHGVEFYERYHNISLNSDIIGMTAREILKKTLRFMREEDVQLVRALSESEDLVTNAADQGMERADVPPLVDAPPVVPAPQQPRRALRKAQDADPIESLPLFAAKV
jgi:hypothetical protein